MATIVKVEALWRVYQVGSIKVTALCGINLRISPGEFVALKGRSGSGKTTLLNCLGGLDRPTSGKIRMFGRDISTLNNDQLTQWRCERLGLIFQSFGLIPTLSAYENIDLMLRLRGLDYPQRHARVLECLKMVALEDRADHRPYELSGGQQQRVAIARALANHPLLVLADEPTGELDSATAAEILGLFREITQGERVTLLVASHDPAIDSYADRIILLSDGQISEQAEIHQKPQ
jgi:putative ABC transport system ATP-binding protein